MSTGIEWTDETWNPVTGCKKVSEGCRHCYAERMWKRLSAVNMPYHGRAFTDVQTHPDRLQQPLRWPTPRRVFVCSMSDLFHPAVGLNYIYRVFAVMAVAQWHTFQVLTKRPGIMWACLSHPDIQRRIVEEIKRMGYFAHHIQWPLPNVWLGTSIEDQSVVKDRLPALMDAPAAVRFVSAEPLIAPLDLSGYEALDWVIVGGESGKDARPMQPEWAREVRDFCHRNQVAFFFKQWGKKSAGRLLDGVLHDGYPGA